ncbi:MAG TPA: M42 family metallopeptidase [Thermoguttaceae bacterium]|nr:M42 family metallopeptidase [Thermoguttaceae bacterium]
MEPQALEWFKRILRTPSPSGYETPLQAVVREYAGQFADEVSTDVHGNVIAVKNPGAPIRVMLAGHCDQIGLIVQHIDENGFVYLQPIGGWDPVVLVGQRMAVWSSDGPVFGVIARKPIHLITEEERGKAPKMKELWLDVGAANKEEGEKMVRVGDPVTVELEYREMPNHRVVSPAMDDKCGMWVVLESLRRAEKAKLHCALYAVSTVQEEVGLRGAQTSCFGIDPHVGIAVDVTFATDCPTIEKKEEGDISLGRGPVIYRGPNFNPRVVNQLVEAAKSAGLPFQMAAAGKPPGTDARVIQTTRSGVATGLVSIPNRYMHSPVEMICLDDIDHAADLLARFAERIASDVDYTP